MKRIVLLIGLLGALLASAFAQDNLMRVKIPYEFVVGGSMSPAGSYEFAVLNNRTVRITNRDTGKTMFIGFISRIAADSSAQGTARISFDVQDGKHFVEAIWPDQGDGYLIHLVKGDHSHDTVRLK